MCYLGTFPHKNFPKYSICCSDSTTIEDRQVRSDLGRPIVNVGVKLRWCLFFWLFHLNFLHQSGNSCVYTVCRSRPKYGVLFWPVYATLFQTEVIVPNVPRRSCLMSRVCIMSVLATRNPCLNSSFLTIVLCPPMLGPLVFGCVWKCSSVVRLVRVRIETVK